MDYEHARVHSSYLMVVDFDSMFVVEASERVVAGPLTISRFVRRSGGRPYPINFHGRCFTVFEINRSCAKLKQQRKAWQK